MDVKSTYFNYEDCLLLIKYNGNGVGVNRIYFIRALLHRPVNGLRQLAIGFSDDEIVEGIGIRPRRIMTAGLPRAQVHQDLKYHDIVLDQSDYSHVSMALGKGQRINISNKSPPIVACSV